MRVWALASCSGLLALAACSAEQSSPPDLGTAPPDGDDAAEVNAQAGLRATASSPMARPELRPRQGVLDRARFSPRSPQASPLASRSGSNERSLPQADQLRERLQRLRTQHGSRLSSNTPIATAPLPAALTTTPPSPVPQAAVEPSPETLPNTSVKVLSGSPSEGAVTALPTIPRPNVTGPNVTGPNVAAPELGLASSASTAIDLGPVASARPTASQSTVLGRHQGYSTRSQQPTPVITPTSPALSAGLTARLHGAQPIAPSGESAPLAAQPSSPTEVPEAATPDPAQPEGATPEAAPLATADVEVGVAPESADSEPSPSASTSHQSSATLALTLTPQPAETSASASPTHHSRGRAARPAIATAPHSWSATITPPESLPLNQGTPRLSPLRPTATTPANTALTVPESATPELEAQPSATQTSATPTAEAQISEAPILEAQTPGSTFSAHQGQGQPESLSLSPQPAAIPKDLPAAYCLHTSGLPLDSEAQAELELQGAGQPLDQLSRLSSLADDALALGEGVSKAESAAACLVENRAAAAPAASAAPAVNEVRPALPLD